MFKDLDVDYCQYKPEIIIREDGGQQRELDFWLNKVNPLLKQAKKILGDKFQINGYKFNYSSFLFISFATKKLPIFTR